MFVCAENLSLVFVLESELLSTAEKATAFRMLTFSTPSYLIDIDMRGWAARVSQKLSLIFSLVSELSFNRKNSHNFSRSDLPNSIIP